MNDVDHCLALLNQNLPAYQQLEESLEQEHRGEYAVLRGGVLVGVCKTAEDADAKGTEASERSDFAVFKIGRERLRYA